MAGIVADYVVIVDKEFQLMTGGDVDMDFAFELPGSLMGNQPSIISFMLDIDSDGELAILINGREVVHSDIRITGFPHCVQEVIREPLLESPRNTITFVVADGSVRISDVVIWFQRD